MADTLERMKVNLLFCIGGDGTLRGAQAIVDEIGRRKLPIGVVGIPKTIDNDLRFVERSFGYETAVHMAADIVTSAHTEAEGADNGIGIVRLMGRVPGSSPPGARWPTRWRISAWFPKSTFRSTGNTACSGRWSGGWTRHGMRSWWWPKGPGRSCLPGPKRKKTHREMY